jgi:ParB-like chromosome segregation protein Spo0J
VAPDPCAYVLLPTDSIRPSAIAAIGVPGPTEAEIKACAQTLRLNGEMAHPLTVRPSPEGGYEVVDGALRLLAAAYLGWAYVPCRVRVLTDPEAMLVSTVLDLGRRKPPPNLQRAWAIAEALSLLGLRPVDFAAISRYSEGEISEARRFARAFPRDAVQRAAAEHGAAIEDVLATPRDRLRRGAAEVDTAARVSDLVTGRVKPATATGGRVLSMANGTVRIDLAKAQRRSVWQRLMLVLKLLIFLTIGPRPASRIFAKVGGAKSLLGLWRRDTPPHAGSPFTASRT